MTLLTNFAVDLRPYIAVVSAMSVSLAVAIFVTIYSQHRQSKREKFKELRSNLLAVALESRKINAWIENLRNDYPKNLDNVASVQRLIASGLVEKMQAIAFLYFPKISQNVTNLSLAIDQYKEYLRTSSENQQSKNLPHTDHQSSLQKLWGEIDEAHFELAEATQALMKDLLNEKLPTEEKSCRLMNILRCLKRP